MHFWRAHGRNDRSISVKRLCWRRERRFQNVTLAEAPRSTSAAPASAIAPASLRAARRRPLLPAVAGCRACRQDTPIFKSCARRHENRGSMPQLLMRFPSSEQSDGQTGEMSRLSHGDADSNLTAASSFSSFPPPHSTRLPAVSTPSIAAKGTVPLTGCLSLTALATFTYTPTANEYDAQLSGLVRANGASRRRGASHFASTRCAKKGWNNCDGDGRGVAGGSPLKPLPFAASILTAHVDIYRGRRDVFA